MLDAHPRRIAFGQDADARPPAIVLINCPPCSYYDAEAGHCVVCRDGEQRGECHNCKHGVPDPGPWYSRSEIIVPIVVSAVSSALGAVATYYIMKRVR